MANSLIAIAYFGICAAIVLPLARSGQLRTNPLGAATAAIFFTCAVHHGAHSVHMLLPAFGLDDNQGLAMRAAWGWPLAIWDVVGALVATYYWTLRRNYGSLMEGAQLFQDLRQREQQALELNDAVLQGLVVAKMALDLDQPRKANEALTSSIQSASRIITELLGSSHASLDLLRSVPAAAGGPAVEEESVEADGSGEDDTVISVAQRARPVRVVIIDDTYDLRELLRLALTRGGLEVVGEAGDGLSGIECVRLEKPDVVLLDLSMPVMDGLEALPTIRRLVPQAKIVVLSGFGATQMSEKAMTIGADGYLQKGMALKRIIEYVKDIVDDPRPVRQPAVRSERHHDQHPDRVITDAVEQSAHAAPVLSVVPDSTDPDVPDEVEARAEAAVAHATGTTEEAPVHAERNSDGAPDVSTWEALAMSPYGVIEVADEPLFRLVHANPMAQRLLDHRARFGTPLGSIAPELASLVAFNRLDGESSFEVVVNENQMQASLRRANGSLLVYLDSSSEDIGILRRAIATTAQEIRGPVAVLCGVAESITAGGSEMSDSQRQRLMSSVTRQARMLDSITADLLTAAEIQRGTLHLDPKDVDPLTVIDTVISDRYLVTVSAQVEDDRQISADPMRLEQMLSNLVGNALKYGRAPYVVRVEADPMDAHKVRIVVIDSGEGVPEDFRDQLFREFSRPNGAVATGTGLGLYVVRCLAEAQGGSVDYSPGPTGGAVFTLTLPAV